jgi:hypothetical protein
VRLEYTNWQFDIERAPKGRTVKALRSVKDTKTGEKVELSYDEYQADHIILATKCGKVTRSYWIPEQDRWCMLAKGEEPLAWQPWPEHPSKAKQTEDAR